MKTSDPSMATFIVRLTYDQDGAVSGVVERVSTGVKERFEDCESLCQLIAAMIERDRA